MNIVFGYGIQVNNDLIGLKFFVYSMPEVLVSEFDFRFTFLTPVYLEKSLNIK